MLISNEVPGDLDFLTWRPETNQADPGSVDKCFRRAYEEIADHLRRHQQVLLLERIYSEAATAEAALAARAAAFKDAGLTNDVPPTWVEGSPCSEASLAGIQAIATGPARDMDVSLLSHHGQVCGRVVTTAEARYLALSNISRALEPKQARQPAAETEAAILTVEQILGEAGWSFRDVFRTWFYLRDILDWYGEFNEVRNAAFKHLGLTGTAQASHLPASTGVGGRNLRDSWCTLDLLAAQRLPGHAFHIERLSNPQQNEAPEYGSAFARGLCLATDLSRSMFVSGTASINENGDSIHPEDFVRQTEQTIDTVRALLQAAAADLDDICQATAFIKRPCDVEAYHQLIRRLGLESLPAVCMIGDICREELLFELDATAVVLAADTRPLPP